MCRGKFVFVRIKMDLLDETAWFCSCPFGKSIQSEKWGHFSLGLKPLSLSLKAPNK